VGSKQKLSVVRCATQLAVAGSLVFCAIMLYGMFVGPTIAASTLICFVWLALIEGARRQFLGGLKKNASVYIYARNMCLLP
jgi:hypothetical protein